MKYFVSADIHGFFDEWMLALHDAGFNPRNPNHMIIVCGDLFDRGRQPKEIINFINNIPEKIILIRGNHEDLAQAVINTNALTSIDVGNGTAGTFCDLDPKAFYSMNSTMGQIADKSGLTNILNKCYNYYETNNYIFVHGWIPVTPTHKYKKNWRNATKKEWNSSRWFSCVEAYKRKLFEPNKTIVCGHWHCSALWHYESPEKYDEFGQKENFEPFITKDIIALDACTVYSKKVN